MRNPKLAIYLFVIAASVVTYFIVKVGDRQITFVDKMHNRLYDPLCLYKEHRQLPDPRCTPGNRDLRVRQSTIKTTICVRGYTRTVRPPVSVTEPMKYLSMRQYGNTDSVRNYEYDHLIPLELGGSSKITNLWPQPHTNSFSKDGIENHLKFLVCGGKLSLRKAQHQIATNWMTTQ